MPGSSHGDGTTLFLLIVAALASVICVGAMFTIGPILGLASLLLAAFNWSLMAGLLR